MKTTFFKKQIPAVLVFIILFIACGYRIDFVVQPYSADINSSFEVELSVSMNPGGG